MKQKPALFLSITLTVFVIVMLSTVIANADILSTRLKEEDQDLSSENISDVDRVYLEREQQLVDAINEANQQIVDMQQLIAATIEAGGTVEFSFTKTQAEIIANAAVIGDFHLAGNAELVIFEGNTAFEVPFINGDEEGLIYIDADLGTVLFNGTVVYDPPRFYEAGAALVASEYLDRNDVVGSVLDTLNGEEVYMVTFGNHDVVFVSKYGVLLQVRLSDHSGSYSDHNDNDDNDDYEDNEDNHNNDD